MRKIVVTAILFVGIWSATTEVASAADFYFISSSDMEHITILDPSTIATAPSGHKTFHLAEITLDTLWTDTGIEVDCVSNRARMTSVISHLAGGDALDLSSQNQDVNVWHDLDTGSGMAQTRDLVCRYPGQKPTGNQVMSFPDFQSAIGTLSRMISDKKEGK